MVTKSIKPPVAAKKVTTSVKARTVVKKVPLATKPQSVVAVTQPASKVKTAEKIKKIKMVRDSYTIPKTEHKQLEALKTRALKLSHAVKKSELLRAGLSALVAMPDQALLKALKAVCVIKTGRPKK